MGNPRYVFEPKIEVADWIDDNIDSWTVFCYDNVYRIQKKNFNDRLNRLANIFSFGLIGMILLCLCLLVNISVWVYLVLLLGGICMVMLCFLCFLLEVKPHGKK